MSHTLLRHKKEGINYDKKFVTYTKKGKMNLKDCVIKFRF